MAWKWGIPLDVYELAQKARSHDDAYSCLLAWSMCCSICGHGVEGILVLDHDHSDGLIRGILCSRCNNREPHRMGVFESYRKLTPASLIDLNVTYRNWQQLNRKALRKAA